MCLKQFKLPQNSMGFHSLWLLNFGQHGKYEKIGLLVLIYSPLNWGGYAPICVLSRSVVSSVWNPLHGFYSALSPCLFRLPCFSHRGSWQIINSFHISRLWLSYQFQLLWTYSFKLWRCFESFHFGHIIWWTRYVHYNIIMLTKNCFIKCLI